MNVIKTVKLGAQAVGRYLKTNKALVLRIVGNVCDVAATAEGIRATVKATRMIDEQHIEGKKNVVKACWKTYIPTAALEAGSLTCSILSGHWDHATILALTAAAASSEKNRKEVVAKVKEIFGDDKAKELDDAILTDRVKKADFSNENMRSNMSDNEKLAMESLDAPRQPCFDEWTQRPFLSNKTILDKIEVAVQKELLCEHYMSLNEVYDLMNMTHVPNGDDIGWNSADDFVIDYDSKLMADGRTALVAKFTTPPHVGYIHGSFAETEFMSRYSGY